MQIIDQAREEAEEGLLLERGSLFLVHVSKHQDKDRKNLGQVMNLRLVVVDAGCIPVVLDDVDDEP